MARQRTTYTLVGKYKEGKEVVAYELQAEGTEGTKRVTVDQMAYFVGRGVVNGVTAQIYNGKLLYRGVGDSIGTKEASKLKTKTSKLAATKTADEVAAAAPPKRRGRPPKKNTYTQTSMPDDNITKAINNRVIYNLSELEQLLAKVRLAKLGKLTGYIDNSTVGIANYMAKVMSSHLVYSDPKIDYYRSDREVSESSKITFNVTIPFEGILEVSIMPSGEKDSFLALVSFSYNNHHEEVGEITIPDASSKGIKDTAYAIYKSVMKEYNNIV